MGGRLDRKIGKNQGREKMPKREVAHIEKNFLRAICAVEFFASSILLSSSSSQKYSSFSSHLLASLFVSKNKVDDNCFEEKNTSAVNKTLQKYF